jgi:hypothetical protein
MKPFLSSFPFAALIAMLAGSTIHAATIEGPVPLPRHKPAAPRQTPAAPAPAGQPQQARQPAGETPDLEFAARCLAALHQQGVIAKAVDPFRDEKDSGCGIDDPVKITAITIKGVGVGVGRDRPGMRFSPPMLLSCTFAAVFTGWLQDVVAPLADYHLATPLRGLAAGPGYVCRRRNNRPGGKLSEHAFGNAADLMQFSFGNGKKLPVAAWNSAAAGEKAFLKAVRGTACGYFTTVLGPGSAYHDTHFHLDRGIHGRSGNYRICE